MFANTTVNVLIADDHPLVVTGVESALRDLRSLRIVGTARNSTQIVEGLGQRGVARHDPAVGAHEADRRLRAMLEIIP